MIDSSAFAKGFSLSVLSVFGLDLKDYHVLLVNLRDGASA